MGGLMIAFTTVFIPVLNRMLPLMLIIGLITVSLILKKSWYGVFVLFFLSIFMFYIQRSAPTSFPLGVVYDFLAIVTFFSLLLTERNKQDWTNFFNPVTWVFLILIFYHLIQVFNPMGTTIAWVVSLRRHVLFVLYLLFFQLVLDKKNLRKLISMWLGFAVVVALYGIYQEIFGLSQAELNWIYSNPDRISIYVVWGEMRNFSFLSDPSAYGIFMAFSTLTCMIYTIRKPGLKSKITYGTMSIVMLLAMNFSGTRTAYAMIAAGLMLYGLLTFRNPKTLWILFSASLLFIVIFFGPFYGWQVNRIRSAFSPSDDPSMGVRDQKRLKYQPYIQDHPIGGGVYTTAFYGLMYAPNHPFAGFDPDSGYLEMAMESGWIGLIILLVFMFVIVRQGIDNYFKLRSPELKTILLAHLVPFFSLSIAHFAQNAIYPKPVDLLVVISMAIIAQIGEIEKDSKHLTSNI